MQDREKIRSEEDYIISCYKTYFLPFPNRKLAIYGIGKNTRIILENFPNENIVGLMDECRAGEEIYGKRILTMSEAVEKGVDVVLIVARASNVGIIYRRISEECTRRGIPVYDINGEEVKPKAAAIRDYSGYDPITFENLKQKIDAAEVVSFDIFDTLVMRDVLYPRDIFSLVEKKVGHEFRKRRVRAEMDLYAEEKNPSLEEIYARMGASFVPEDELQTEREHLYIRKSGQSALAYALQQGKKVYLVSDMYLNSAILEELLQGLGLMIGKAQILVSCEHGASKHNGLFSILKKQVGNRTILHIGDNLEADVESAKRFGIEDAFYIPSALKMLEDSYADSLLAYTEALESRLVIGKLLLQMFSDGFLFHNSRGKLVVSDNRQIGSVFIAPFIYRFYGWLLEEAGKRRLTHVLLAARDGRIFEKIYQHFKEKGFKQPQMDYFYISRAVAVLAGIKDDEDIMHCCRLAFNGSTEELLKVRFRLTDRDCAKGGKIGQDAVLQYRESIFESAKAMRGRFRKYIRSVCKEHEERIGFFDFISSGTCQKALMNIVDFHVEGLYVGNVNNETEYKPEIDVSSMFGENSYNVFKKGYSILNHYFLLENIMTSEEPTLIDFDQEGHPVFGEESRTEEQLKDLEDIQDGILAYIKESSLRPEEMQKVDLKLVDEIFALLNGRGCVVETDYFKEHSLEDAFCNRKFELTLPQ